MIESQGALEEMVTTQRAFQERVDPRFRSVDVTERVAYIKDMYVALIQEAGEALNETSWKPWTTCESNIHLAELLTELTDVWCFLCNMWLAAMPDATVDEIATAMLITYRTKMEINHRRQDEGYDGMNKCPVCGRATDDGGVSVDTSGVKLCHGCGATWA